MKSPHLLRLKPQLKPKTSSFLKTNMNLRILMDIFICVYIVQEMNIDQSNNECEYVYACFITLFIYGYFS